MEMWISTQIVVYITLKIKSKDTRIRVLNYLAWNPQKGYEYFMELLLVPVAVEKCNNNAGFIMKWQYFVYLFKNKYLMSASLINLIIRTSIQFFAFTDYWER